MDSVRGAVRKLMRVIAKALNRLSAGRISPNMVTVIGLLAHFGIAYLIVLQEYYWAAGLLIVFGLFDTLDGELARLQKRESRFGMYLDSVTDRIKEVLLYIAAGYSLVHTNQSYWAVWVIAACGTALLVSYTNAWGEAVMSGIKLQTHKTNSSLRAGLMSFEVRMFLLVIGLLFDQLSLALVVITIGSALTALIRINGVRRKLGDVQD